MSVGKRCEHFELGGYIEREGQVNQFRADFVINTINYEFLLSSKKEGIILKMKLERFREESS